MTDRDQVSDLQAIWQHLAARWAESEHVWQDTVRQDFATRFMIPLEVETAATVKAMQNLLEVIAKAQRQVK